MLTVLLFIAVLALLVLAHELGHFVVAKLSRMKVEEFGFGFPPRLWGVQKGDTMYSVNAIPLGGFVKIKGESGEGSDDPDSFASQAGWKRFLVLVAGVGMNLVLAAVLLTAGFMIGLPSVIDETIPADAQVSQEVMRVGTVAADSPASRAGLAEGDELVSIDGVTFASPETARAYIGEHGSGGIHLVLAREDGTQYVVTLTSEDLKAAPGVHGVGVGLVETGLVSFPPLAAVGQGVTATGYYTENVVLSFVDLVRNLVVNHKAGVELSGPVGIAVLTGQAAALGLSYLLQFTALLSINLAVVNVLPLPALDGGRLLFLVIEKVRGRSVDGKTEAVVHNVGFALLMTLVVFVTYHDLAKYGPGMWDAVRHLIG
jgi:regulator of sigma E protease